MTRLRSEGHETSEFSACGFQGEQHNQTDREPTTEKHCPNPPTPNALIERLREVHLLADIERLNMRVAELENENRQHASPDLGEQLSYASRRLTPEDVLPSIPPCLKTSFPFNLGTNSSRILRRQLTFSISAMTWPTVDGLWLMKKYTG